MLNRHETSDCSSPAGDLFSIRQVPKFANDSRTFGPGSASELEGARLSLVWAKLKMRTQNLRHSSTNRRVRPTSTAMWLLTSQRGRRARRQSSGSPSKGRTTRMPLQIYCASAWVLSRPSWRSSDASPRFADGERETGGRHRTNGEATCIPPLPCG